MTGVLIAMAAFVFSHVAIARTALKPAIVARIGARGYLAIYSVVSIALLSWVIISLRSAERAVLWSPPLWSHAFAALATAAAFVLIGVGVAAPNPLSVSIRQSGFDPDRPGAVGFVRHPLIWGLALWGLAHTPANGDWPSLVLFAGSAAFGAIGAPLVERRRRRALGEAAWRRMTAGRGALDQNALLGAGAGLVLWAAFLLAHPLLFGVDPLAVLRAGAL